VSGVKVTAVNPQTRFTYSINAGIRWSYQSPYPAKYQSELEPKVVDPLAGRMGAITHPAGAPTQRRWHNLDPPIRVAWTLRKNLAFRGSFGRSTMDLLANDTNVAFDEYCPAFKPTARSLTGGLTTAGGRPPDDLISNRLLASAAASAPCHVE
jgi:hypothetical protein